MELNPKHGAVAWTYPARFDGLGDTIKIACSGCASNWVVTNSGRCGGLAARVDDNDEQWITYPLPTLHPGTVCDLCDEDGLTTIWNGKRWVGGDDGDYDPDVRHDSRCAECGHGFTREDPEPCRVNDDGQPRHVECCHVCRPRALR